MAAHSDMVIPRRTLAGTASIAGVGLFTAKPATLRIGPVRLGAGIVFRRIDLASGVEIPADAAHVVPESRRTVLSANPNDASAPTVQTVEHVLSALAGLGVSDAVVEVTGPEVPIMDGSSAPFVDAVVAAGVVEGAGEHARPIVVRDPVVVEDRGGRVEAYPARPGMEGVCELVYRLSYPPGAPIAAQEARILLTPGAPSQEYARAVAPARTFCMQQEAEAMRKAGLFTHLAPRDMLVIGEQGPIDNAYRFDDEPARHKLLDLIGDLALAGRPILGRVVAVRSGHAHNHAMARALGAL